MVICGKPGECCCGFILTSGLSALVLWLNLRASLPKCSIHYIYLPALNHSPSNTTIFIDLKLDNVNKEEGIYYDQLNLTVFYAPNATSSAGNATIPAFYQGYNKKAIKKSSAPASRLDWGAALRAVSANSSAVFRVNLETLVRYKNTLKKSKRERLRVGADVEVNNQGTKVKRKDIEMKSGAPMIGNGGLSPGRASMTVLLLVLLVVSEN